MNKKLKHWALDAAASHCLRQYGSGGYARGLRETAVDFAGRFWQKNPGEYVSQKQHYVELISDSLKRGKLKIRQEQTVQEKANEQVRRMLWELPQINETVQRYIAAQQTL